MKIILATVGKPTDKVLQDAISDFTKRIERYFSVEWLFINSVKNAATLSAEELKRGEAVIILNNILKDDFLVLLDEKGKQISSVELANFVQQRANESIKRLVFLIGGAFGVSELVNQRANYVWSLSKLVFPHQIVRLVLAEQVYRACTILRNEKYHHP